MQSAGCNRESSGQQTKPDAKDMVINSRVELGGSKCAGKETQSKRQDTDSRG
jgi:hypothetical protein